MTFDLALPFRQFEGMDRVARSVLTNSRMEARELRLITSDSSLLTADNQGYLVDNPECLGVCFGQEDNSQFDIWVSPAYKDTDTDFYKDTVLHELCHGYFGMYVHNHRWKRIFGRVLHHYSSLVEPLDTDTLIPNMLKRYTRQGGGESTGKYWERLENEQDSIAKAAVAELPFISRTFDRLGSREALVA